MSHSFGRRVFLFWGECYPWTSFPIRGHGRNRGRLGPH